MDRVKSFQIYFSWIVAAAALAVSYELRAGDEIGMSNTLVSAVAFLIARSLSAPLARFLTCSRTIRRVLMWSNYVEGWWFLETEMSDGKDSAASLRFNGILNIEYNPLTNEYSVRTIRIDDKGVEFIVCSEIAHIRKDMETIRYLNYFKLTHPGPIPEYGMSQGNFSRTKGISRIPECLDAQIFTEKGPTRRQWAQRIPDSSAKKLQKEHGINWCAKFLNDDDVRFSAMGLMPVTVEEEAKD